MRRLIEPHTSSRWPRTEERGYERYFRWCSQQGLVAVIQRKFGSDLKRITKAADDHTTRKGKDVEADKGIRLMAVN
jgi:hypothetical protein